MFTSHSQYLEATYNLKLIIKDNTIKAKTSDGKPVNIHKLDGYIESLSVASKMDVLTLRQAIIEQHTNKKEFVKSKTQETYDLEYIEKLKGAEFAVTHFGSPDRGYKIYRYPSGHEKVNPVLQSINYMKNQLGLNTEDGDGKLSIKTRYALEAYNPFDDRVFFPDADKENYYLNMYLPSYYMQLYRGYHAPNGLTLNYNMVHMCHLNPILQAFFYHLLPNPHDRAWFMDWLTFSVFDMCETIPVFLGEGGTGKGTLTTLWNRMLGKDNYTPMNASSLEGEFAMANFANKRGVSINEGRIETGKQMENLKNSTDRRIRVNDKHEKFKTVEKTCSIMYTANHLNAFKIRGTDGELIDPVKERRFSFLNITNDALKEKRVQFVNELGYQIDVTFTERVLDELNGQGVDMDAPHKLTLELFSYLAYLYDNKKATTAVKTTSYINTDKAKQVAEANTPNWYDVSCEHVFCVESLYKIPVRTQINNYTYYLTLADIKEGLKDKINSNYIPSYENMLKALKIRENSVKDIKVARQNLVHNTRVYFKNDYYQQLISAGKE